MYNKLGLKLVQSTSEWAIFDIGGIEFVLLPGASPNSTFAYGQTCGTVLCLKSGSIETDILKLRERKVRIVQEIQTVPQGQFAVISDPDGNHIEVIQH